MVPERLGSISPAACYTPVPACQHTGFCALEFHSPLFANDRNTPTRKDAGCDYHPTRIKQPTLLIGEQNQFDQNHNRRVRRKRPSPKPTKSRLPHIYNVHNRSGITTKHATRWMSLPSPSVFSSQCLRLSIPTPSLACAMSTGRRLGRPSFLGFMTDRCWLEFDSHPPDVQLCLP
jgi:hypothetical protein